MRRLVFYWCFIALSVGIAQAGICQSNTPSDSTQVAALLRRVDEMISNGNFVQAHALSDEAISYSLLHNYPTGEAFGVLKKAEVSLEENDLEHVKSQAMRAFSIGRALKNQEIMALSELLQAQALMYGNQVKESLVIFEKVIENYFRDHPSEDAALAYNDYGYALGMNGNPESQISNLIIARELLEQVNPENYAELGVTLNNISVAYYTLREMPKAIDYALQSIAYRKKAGDKRKMALGYCNISQFYRGIDQAKVEEYLGLCAQYAEEAGDEDRMSQAYITSALLYSDQGDREKALEYETKAVEILEKKAQDPVMISRRYLSMAMHAVALDRDSLTVMNYFNQSLAYNQKNLNKVNFRDLYQQMAFFFRSKNDYHKAYDYFNLHTLYRDSIIQENTLSNIAELEKKYEIEKKDNEILKLLNQDQLNELEIERQKSLLSRNNLEAEQKEQAIALLTQTQELSQLRIDQQNEELLKQELVAKTNQQQLQLASQQKELQDRQLQQSKLVRNLSLLGIVLLGLIAYFLFSRYKLKRKILEQESMLAIRGDIAKDLHDEVGSILTSIKILSEVSAKQIGKPEVQIHPYLNQITEQSMVAQQGISDIVWAVNPENDKIGDLLARMREYLVKTLEPKNIAIQMQVDEQMLSKKVGMNQRRDFLLMFKEAINNIAKHADAKTVSIQLIELGSNLTLTIRDDGVGFDTEPERTSSGLKNLVARAKAMGGSCLITSTPMSGTEVHMILPST